MQGELKAVYSANVTGLNLKPLAAELKYHGYDIVTHGPADDPVHICVRDYDARVMTIVNGIFGLKGCLNRRRVKLNPPRFVAA